MFLKVVFVLVSAVICVAIEFPPFIKKCRFGDVKCIVKTATATLKNYPTELSQVGFIQFDPWRVHKITLDDNSRRPIDLKMTLTENLLHGLSKLNFDKAVGWTKDAANSKFELYGNIPTLNFTGKYNVDGRIMFLPIQGNGEYNMVLDDVLFQLKFKPSVEVKNGKQYLKIQKLKMRIDPAKFYINLTNLFNGNEELGSSLNDVLNKNWRDAWDELAPAMYEVVEAIGLESMQGFFDIFAYEDIFEEE